MWEKIEIALINAVGKNAKVKLTHDYFANKNPLIEGKGIYEDQSSMCSMGLYAGEDGNVALSN